MMDPWLIKFLRGSAAQCSKTNDFQSMASPHDSAIALPGPAKL
uniref:Uncharacterized protein n=1 Tax=Curvibacter symbiont subsp. Hydra magnipapillata TaxID=667019 RepID=C9Y6V1_CURXX|nr:hypothetical protein Csp_H39340 [Curvibacter putative symbiont of Hydra magnipapillata]